MRSNQNSFNISKIDVVYLHTASPTLRDWFTDVLELSRGYGDDHWQEFLFSNDTRFALDFPQAPVSAVEQQSVMISFAVDDIAAAAAHLQEKGVVFFSTAAGIIFDVGPTLVASFQDPDGNWHQLSQRKR